MVPAGLVCHSLGGRQGPAPWGMAAWLMGRDRCLFCKAKAIMVVIGAAALWHSPFAPPQTVRELSFVGLFILNREMLI